MRGIDFNNLTSYQMNTNHRLTQILTDLSFPKENNPC